MKPKKPTPAAPKTRTMPRPYAILVESHLLNTNKGQEGVLIPVAVVPCRTLKHARAVAKLHGDGIEGRLRYEIGKRLAEYERGKPLTAAQFIKYGRRMVRYFNFADPVIKALGLAPGGEDAR